MSYDVCASSNQSISGFSSLAEDLTLVLHGSFADFSAALPMEWTSPAAEIDVIDTVTLMADSNLEDIELAGKIALVSRGGGVDFVDKVTRVAEAGAVGVIIANFDDGPLRVVAADSGYKADIPVLTISSRDAARMREHGGALIRAIRDKGTPRLRFVCHFHRFGTSSKTVQSTLDTGAYVCRGACMWSRCVRGRLSVKILLYSRRLFDIICGRHASR